MLYKIKKEEERFSELEPVAFKDFMSFGKSEKDLENLLSENLFSVIFEDGNIMPIFQERQGQPEADIYGLNENGDLIIFELKRSSANEGALHQVLRYSQKAGRWNYAELESKFNIYEKKKNISLKEAHKEAFDLEEVLLEKEFNQKQKLVVIGSAADNSLISAIDYWKNSGLDIDFMPYRVYQLNDEIYFEFFAKPYDRHINPSTIKGVLFDTNRNYDENAVWEMFDNDYVAAYGDIKHVIRHIKKKDIVFLTHKGYGIVGAARVKSDVVKKDNHTWYRKVEFLTRKPERGEIRAVSFRDIKSILNKNFYWAKTIKVPYLSKKEAKILLDETKEKLK